MKEILIHNEKINTIPDIPLQYLNMNLFFAYIVIYDTLMGNGSKGNTTHDKQQIAQIIKYFFLFFLFIKGNNIIII